jgi:apolipoprotein N-acyltransferase
MDGPGLEKNSASKKSSPGFLKKLARFFKSFITDPNKRLALLSALLFCLAYPPMPLGFLAYFCLVPILIAASGNGFKTGFKYGYLFGFVQAAVLLYWVGVGIHSYGASANLDGNLFLIIFLGYIAPVGAPIALALIQALFAALLFGVYGWLSRGKGRNFLVFPFIWTAVEYIRTLSEFAFPWIQLGYTQSMYIPMIQTAAWWGDLGVGFWIAVVNVILFLAWKFRHKIKLAAYFAGLAVMILAAAFIYGTTVSYEPTGEKIKVGLLQGNITLKEKFSPGSLQMSLERHTDMAHSIAKDSCDLVIFAETTVREILLRGSTRHHFSRLARDLNANLLIGTFDRVENGDRVCDYNSAVQCDPRGDFEYVHHKIRLVPFSEKIPYNQYFSFINDFHFGQSDFCMGDSISVFKTDKGDYSVLICFEVGFSDLNREAVRKGAQFLVTITNDTWWGISAGPYQHAYMVPFRAVENRRWFARCANSGFSFFCSPDGKIEDLGKLFEKIASAGYIYTNDEITFFTKHGLWLPKILLLFTFLFILNRIIIKIVKRTGKTADEN